MVKTSQPSLAPRSPWLAWLAPHRREPWPWLKPGIFLGALVPLGWLAYRARSGGLSADPIAQVINEFGMIALIFLWAALACSPLRWLLGWTWPMRIRRELGLFAFCYALLHSTTYLALDQVFDWRAVVEDIVERPFITVGFLALVLMIPLAVTSTAGWVRRLGFVRWQGLHRVVYAAGALAAVHFIWRVKLDVSQPLIYAAIFVGLIALRVVFWLRKRTVAEGKAQLRGG